MKITTHTHGTYEFRVESDNDAFEFDSSLNIIQMYAFSEYFQEWVEVNTRQFKIDFPVKYEELEKKLYHVLLDYKMEQAQEESCDITAFKKMRGI